MVANSNKHLEWPLELVLHLADFLVSHLLYDLGGSNEHVYIVRDTYQVKLDALEKRVMLSCGLNGEEFERLKGEAQRIEQQCGFFSISTVLQYCVANSPAEVRASCLKYALTCETRQRAKQEAVAEIAKRYGLHPDAEKHIAPLQVVYGADFLSHRSPSLLIPIVLIFDHILSDEGIVFTDDEYYSKVLDDFKVLKREGILVPYHWGIVHDSVLYRDRELIRQIETESEEMYLRTEEDEEERLYAPMNASHGYATSLKLSIPSLILPGDEPPNTFKTAQSAKALPSPDLASNIWVLQALSCVLDSFALSELPVEEVLSIREEVRKGDAHAEFRDLALTEVGRLKDDLRGASFPEICGEIQFNIKTNFMPALNRLQREIKEIDRKRNRKFLSKVRQEGASLTINLLGLLTGPDRGKALTEISKILYSSADSSLSEVKAEIPNGFAFALSVSRELEKRLNTKHLSRLA